MNKFEQLIEYVINDEDQKARELFHDIVVAKSREIYENLMQEEEDIEEGTDDDIEEDAVDAQDDLIDDVETEEQSDLSMEGDEESEDGDVAYLGGDEFDHDEFGGGDEDSMEPATKDDIMNLEDKLDELMAEFEAAMGGDKMGSNGDDFGPEAGGDAIEMDDTGEMDEVGMMEAISLKPAPKPVTAEQGNGKAGPVAFNAGQVGMAGRPVHTGTSQGGNHDTAAYRNATKDLIGRVGNSPSQGTQQPKPANKPHLSQATGVNTKSPLPGRKG